MLWLFWFLVCFYLDLDAIVKKCCCDVYWFMIIMIMVGIIVVFVGVLVGILGGLVLLCLVW